jgi:hypothetical protein
VTPRSPPAECPVPECPFLAPEVQQRIGERDGLLTRLGVQVDAHTKTLTKHGEQLARIGGVAAGAAAAGGLLGGLVVGLFFKLLG